MEGALGVGFGEIPVALGEVDLRAGDEGASVIGVEIDCAVEGGERGVGLVCEIVGGGEGEMGLGAAGGDFDEPGEEVAGGVEIGAGEFDAGEVAQRVGVVGHAGEDLGEEGACLLGLSCAEEDLGLCELAGWWGHGYGSDGLRDISLE